MQQTFFYFKKRVYFLDILYIMKLTWEIKEIAIMNKKLNPRRENNKRRGFFIFEPGCLPRHKRLFPFLALFYFEVIK